MDALDKLKPKFYVMRAGSIIQSEAVDIMPGDVVFLRSGQKSPVDGRVLVFKPGTLIDNSELTGKSYDIQACAVDSTSTHPVDSRNIIVQHAVLISGQAFMMAVHDVDKSFNSNKPRYTQPSSPYKTGEAPETASSGDSSTWGVKKKKFPAVANSPGSSAGGKVDERHHYGKGAFWSVSKECDTKHFKVDITPIASHGKKKKSYSNLCRSIFKQMTNHGLIVDSFKSINCLANISACVIVVTAEWFDKQSSVGSSSSTSSSSGNVVQEVSFGSIAQFCANCAHHQIHVLFVLVDLSEEQAEVLQTRAFAGYSKVRESTPRASTKTATHAHQEIHEHPRNVTDDEANLNVVRVLEFGSNPYVQDGEQENLNSSMISSFQASQLINQVNDKDRKRLNAFAGGLGIHGGPPVILKHVSDSQLLFLLAVLKKYHRILYATPKFCYGRCFLTMTKAHPEDKGPVSRKDGKQRFFKNNIATNSITEDEQSLMDDQTSGWTTPSNMGDVRTGRDVRSRISASSITSTTKASDKMSYRSYIIFHKTCFQSRLQTTFIFESKTFPHHSLFFVRRKSSKFKLTFLYRATEPTSVCPVVRTHPTKATSIN